MQRRTLKLAPVVLAIPLVFGCALEQDIDDPIADDIAMEHAAPDSAQTVPADRVALFATVHVATSSNNGTHFPIATVEIVDENRQPAAFVEITGSFIGDIEETYTVITDEDGLAGFKTPAYNGHLAVGFQVDSVHYSHNGQMLRADVTGNAIPPIQCQHIPTAPTE